jgi:hypothetical protein
VRSGDLRAVVRSALPANPFSDLDARDLAAFVECTLYEATPAEEADPLPVPVAAPPRVVGSTARPRSVSRPAPSGARATRMQRIAACAACALLGVTTAIALRWRSAAAEEPAAYEPAVAAAPPAPSPPPGAPAVKQGGPEIEELGPAPATETALESPAPRRKTASLIIGSSPPGAEIIVDGESFGRAPARLEVPRFAEVEIEATLPGFAPWRKTVYVSRAETRIGTSLTPIEPTAVADDDATPREP